MSSLPPRITKVPQVARMQTCRNSNYIRSQNIDTPSPHGLHSLSYSNLDVDVSRSHISESLDRRRTFSLGTKQKVTFESHTSKYR